jgi:hypothetical protein
MPEVSNYLTNHLYTIPDSCIDAMDWLKFMDKMMPTIVIPGVGFVIEGLSHIYYTESADKCLIDMVPINEMYEDLRPKLIASFGVVVAAGAYKLQPKIAKKIDKMLDTCNNTSEPISMDEFLNTQTNDSEPISMDEFLNTSQTKSKKGGLKKKSNKKRTIKKQ